MNASNQQRVYRFNRVLWPALLLCASASAFEAPFERGLAEGQGEIVERILKITGRGFALARDHQAARPSPYSAECWRNHIDYQGNKFDYPVCAPLGYAERIRRERNPWAEPAWLNSIFIQSIDPATFEGTPLQAEVLQAVTEAAVGKDSAPRDDAYLSGLLDLLRLATAPRQDPALARRRVNAAVKTRWLLTVLYGRLCEKHQDVCLPGYFADFYAIAKQDWSPRTRITAMSLIYVLEPDRSKRRSALEEMSARDGESLLSVAANGSTSYVSRPSDDNRAFAGHLLSAEPPANGRSWGCFAESLRWGAGSKLSLYSACQ